MKIGGIGANGNLGARIVRRAVEQNHEVTGFVRHGNAPEGANTVQKSLFDLKQEDLKDIDVLISAFGGSFNADPVINRDAYMKYIELMSGTGRKLIAIAGAGSLYTDDTHTLFEYELDSHPAKLKEISKYIRQGVDEISKHDDFDWTAVCPSRFFDAEGPFTGEYLVGEKEEIIYNEDEKSYLTYEDMAQAMLDIAKDRLYPIRSSPSQPELLRITQKIDREILEDIYVSAHFNFYS